MTDAAHDSTTQADPTTPTAAGPGPAKAHGDPLLAASQGASEGTEGTRHGLGATAPAGQDSAGQDSAGQDSAGQDAGQDSDGQGAATPS